MRRLLSDDRGVAALAPVYVIVGVVILAAVVSALFTATTVAQRSSATTQLESATRAAVATMQAELNAKTLPTVISQVHTAGANYQPVSAIPAPGQDTLVTDVVDSGAGTARVTFTITIPGLAPRTKTVEYVGTPLIQQGADWVPAPTGQTPTRWTWAPSRTVVTG